MVKDAFQCNLKDYPQENYLDYINNIIENDQTLFDIFNNDQGQLEDFKNYLKKIILNKPDQIQQDLENLYHSWETHFKVELKRVEIFTLIILMYLGLLERDFAQGGFYVINMKSIKSSMNYICQQKVKCIKHYIKAFYLNKDLIGDQKVVFTKNSVTKDEFNKKFQETNNQNIDFEFTLLKNEDHKNSTVVDFADQNIGGLVLDTRNCAQEEIVMLIFPEAIVSMIFIPQMTEIEAVLIENLKKFSNYTGYEQSFQSFPSQDLISSYNMLAIDAKPFYGENQFTEQNIFRELIKCYAGFELSIRNQPNCYISTGRWGCGIFRGNPILKTLIQFISFGIAINQNKSKNSQIIINCVNDQSLFSFGQQLKQQLLTNGVQLNLINLKQSIQYLQTGQPNPLSQNDIDQIYQILIQNIESNKELINHNKESNQIRGEKADISSEESQHLLVEMNPKTDQKQVKENKNQFVGFFIAGVGILAGVCAYKYLKK